MQVQEASFGVVEADDITIDCSAKIRSLSWTGPGLCTNYFADSAA